MLLNIWLQNFVFTLFLYVKGINIIIVIKIIFITIFIFIIIYVIITIIICLYMFPSISALLSLI